MIPECLVIILILGITAYMFIRSHKKVWAGSVFPLMLVPLVSIMFTPLASKLYRSNRFNEYVAWTILYLLAFAAMSVWTVAWGKKLPVGKSKYAYISVSIAFTFILILIFLHSIVFRP
jgi:hypothetical protein